MAILTGAGLIANLIAGALATRARILKLLGVGLLILACGLAAFPSITAATGRNFTRRPSASAVASSRWSSSPLGTSIWTSRTGPYSGGRAGGHRAGLALGPVLMAECRPAGSYSPCSMAWLSRSRC